MKQQGKRKWSPPKKKDDRYAWKEKRIAGTDILQKNGKTYHWCPHHKAYTLHKLEECRLDPKRQKKDNGNDGAPMTGMTAVYNKNPELNAFGDEMAPDEDE